jgi:hypothetical protein
MQFATKIAVVIRTDLEVWQKLNIASFLTSGIAAAFRSASASRITMLQARRICR